MINHGNAMRSDLHTIRSDADINVCTVLDWLFNVVIFSLLGDSSNYEVEVNFRSTLLYAIVFERDLSAWMKS